MEMTMTIDDYIDQYTRIVEALHKRVCGQNPLALRDNKSPEVAILFEAIDDMVSLHPDLHSRMISELNL
jgi:hypothetical protein